MRILNQLLNKPSPEVSKWIIIPFLLVSFFGFADATYLTVSHYAKAAVPCSLTNGCEVVLTSKYATLSGIPIALFGALYYLSVFILALIYLDAKKVWALNLAFLFVGAGFFISAFLLYLQFFVIRATCVYCVGSAISTTILFILGIFIVRATGMFRKNSL